ncbi:hypothetical protein ACIOG7_08930 [Streptomyces sp. NPDC087894]|uniref:hypothetical protein n=1 Tax=Streptomyces sp. NPDC087894 TaxID=3365816 RepID=UPI0038149D33
MSRSAGPHTADPCPRCCVEAVRTGVRTTPEGRDVVGYLCEQCANAWTRPVEEDLEVYDIVRVDHPGATLYGTVRQVEGGRVQVRGTGGEWLRRAERWQVILY